MGVRLRSLITRFDGWLGDNAASLPALLAEPGVARAHAFYLTETAEQSRYLMTEPEELLAAELSLSGAGAWSKLHGTVTSQLSVRFERNGREELLPVTALQNLVWHDPDPAVRRRAYEAELAAWESVASRWPPPQRRQGRGHHAQPPPRPHRRPAHRAGRRPPRPRRRWRRMLGAMRDVLPRLPPLPAGQGPAAGPSRRLPWWDMHAPVVPAGEGERHFSFAEAEEFIFEHFGQFSRHLAGLARRAFGERWIDAEPRAGKRGGAFCMCLPACDESPRPGQLRRLARPASSRIAHELGHAYHNVCLARSSRCSAPRR